MEEQSINEFDLAGITSATVLNLALLAKIWGFLKYHHPNIAAGQYCWDEQLIVFLSTYLNVENNRERDRVLIHWINSFGPYQRGIRCEPINEAACLKPNFDWICAQSPALQEVLRDIYENRRQDGHYYIDFDEDSCNPIFKNEKGYDDSPYPHLGYRLLALFRYWNIITYFFPYRHLIDSNWNTVLERYIPSLLTVNNALEYQLAILKLIAEIGDSHANLWRGANELMKWKGRYYPPVHIRFVENHFVVSDFYNPEMKDEIGLTIGDVITKVNGMSVENIINERKAYYPASNRAALMRDIAQDLMRSPQDEIDIEYLSVGAQIQIEKLKLYPKDKLDFYVWYREKKERAYRLLENNIGFITLNNIHDSDVSEIKRVFKNTKGIVIDMRNYPDAFVPFSLGEFFLSTPTQFVKFSIGRTFNPGEFVMSEAVEISAGGDTYQGKVVVIVNEITQSQGEYTAMAFRASNIVTLIGSATAGADGNMSDIVLPGGLVTAISGLGIFYPDGSETQRIGIIPDIEVYPTIHGIRDNRDEVLESAVAILVNG